MMEPLISWAFLAIVVQILVNNLAKIVPAIDSVDLAVVEIKLVMAFAFSLLFSIGGRFDFFQMFSIQFYIPYVGMFVAALGMTIGAEGVHQIIEAMNKAREIYLTRQPD